ncbi:MAG: hypothetical protein C5B43_04380, partial [Verrucomicrobia bacterium]
LAFFDAEGTTFIDPTDNLQTLTAYGAKLALISAQKEGNNIKAKIAHPVIRNAIEEKLKEEDPKHLSEILEDILNSLNKAWKNLQIDTDTALKEADLARHAQNLLKELNENNLNIKGKEKLLLNLGAYYLKNSDLDTSLTLLNQALETHNTFHENPNHDFIQILENLGECLANLGGQTNILKAIEYQKEAIKLYQTLLPDDHLSVIHLLKNISDNYKSLDAKDFFLHAIQHQKEAFDIQKKYLPKNDMTLVDSLTQIGLNYQKAYTKYGNRKNLRKAEKNLLEAMGMLDRMQQSETNRLAEAELYGYIGNVYVNLGRHDLSRGKEFLEEAFLLHQELNPGINTDAAEALRDLGNVYIKLKDKWLKGVLCLEESLKMFLILNDHSGLAKTLLDLASAYDRIDDDCKSADYKNQSHSLDPINNQSASRKIILSRAQIDYNFLNVFIHSTDKIDYTLLKIKTEMQDAVLDKIINGVDDYGWSNRGFIFGDWGVKGYLNEDYLKERIGSNLESHIEIAKMLCFEAMNLGIMQSESKPYEVAATFTRENPELVKKIADLHPEFFVDGSIVIACLKAMSHDPIFVEHIIQKVKILDADLKEVCNL